MDERISVEEIDLLEKKLAMKEPLKERRSTQVEEWRETQMCAGGGATQMGATGSRTSETECDLLLSEGRALQKDAEEDQRSLWHQKKSNSNTPQSRRKLETVSQHPEWVEEENEDEMEEPSFVSSAVSEPRWALHMCDGECGEKARSSSKLRLL